MAVSSGYLVRETAGNLRRNLVMTLAAIVTMMVSLAAFGSVLIMKQAIDKASVQWKGGVELAIFLQPGIASNESSAIGHELNTTQGVKKIRFVDQAQAYAEFKTIFGGEPDLLNVLNESQMPPSYRVVPQKAQDVATLGKQFQSQPGVLRVSYAQQEINSLLSRFKNLQIFAYVLAVGVMIGALALIVNTIQLAIFARRREVAVMKLVGATNWFIRVPFMLEGLIHGVVGAFLAFAVTYMFRNSVASFVGNDSVLGGQKLYVTSGEALVVGVAVLALGAVAGVVGSAFAVRRFLVV
ncbi:MAG: ABC transporter permease [Actinomycetota bacterium]|nr:ABC transporter permease [Actinomycetota bacterium]